MRQLNIPLSFLLDTRDIWAVDYMPIQINESTFIRLTYEPDYLQHKKYRHTISEVAAICRALHLTPIPSDLIIDGDNIARTADTVIMCDKVFRENSHLSQKQLTSRLKDLFQIDRLFFLPWDKSDFTGHIDGMLRFIDNDTVLINDYYLIDPVFGNHFCSSLRKAKLN